MISLMTTSYAEASYTEKDVETGAMTLFHKSFILLIVKV